MALVESGPMSVSFEVYPDFMHYSGGVYHHSGLIDKFNPFEVYNYYFEISIGIHLMVFCS